MIKINMHSDMMKIIHPNSGYSKEMEFANKLHDMVSKIEDKNQRYFLFVENGDDTIPHPIGLVVFDPWKLIADQFRPNTIALAFCDTKYDEHNKNECTPILLLEWRELDSINHNICYYEVSEESKRPKGIKRTTSDLINAYAAYRHNYLHIRFEGYYDNGDVMITKTHSNLKQKNVVDYKMAVPVAILKESYNYFNALRVLRLDDCRMPGVVLERPTSYFIRDYKEVIQ